MSMEAAMQRQLLLLMWLSSDVTRSATSLAEATARTNIRSMEVQHGTPTMVLTLAIRDQQPMARENRWPVCMVVQSTTSLEEATRRVIFATLPRLLSIKPVTVRSMSKKYMVVATRLIWKEIRRFR